MLGVLLRRRQDADPADPAVCHLFGDDQRFLDGFRAGRAPATVHAARPNPPDLRFQFSYAPRFLSAFHGQPVSLPPTGKADEHENV